MAPLDFCTFEPERNWIDAVFGVGLVLVGMAIPLGPLLAWTQQEYHRHLGIRPTPPQHKGIFKQWWLAWLFLLPTLTILVLFLYYPGLDTFRLSTLLTFVGAPRSRFVCVDNFTSLLTDSTYLRSIGITFAISAAIIVFGLTGSLLIATLAYQPIRGATIYRILLIWPYAISPAVAGIIFFIMFNPLGGVANYVLSLVGIPRLNWLGDPNLAPWVVIFASVWKQMGYNILFYIAGLQNLPNDLQEAAAIDGAGAFRRFLSITVPLLSPITFFLVITNMTYAFFDIFGTIDLLTAGGPSGSTSVLIYEIYKIGVSSGNLGKAAAQSIVLFLMVVGLTLIQFRTTERNVTYGG
ncbi:sugar ABC transporter permease [Synechococcus bigranulatus str. 'Rupite']|uniref:sn-glycerol-3-phosphate transport system permease protein UgpA n=2 Tax=Thermostichus vulcanus TaxID=32053 RepID=A0ABT0CAM3_THEVL|nr:sugar ABC transporter permease [Thermostichus vulcanus str. 'Rupite']